MQTTECYSTRYGQAHQLPPHSPYGSRMYFCLVRFLVIFSSSLLLFPFLLSLLMFGAGEHSIVLERLLGHRSSHIRSICNLGSVPKERNSAGDTEHRFPLKSHPNPPQAGIHLMHPIQSILATMLVNLVS